MATIEDKPPTDTTTTTAIPEGTVMTRRSALKLAGVGVGGVRAATNGAFTAGSGDPNDLWHDWATMSGVDRVVAAGILACNPHNTQAWRFTATDDVINVYSDPTRRMPATTRAPASTLPAWAAPSRTW